MLNWHVFKIWTCKWIIIWLGLLFPMNMLSTSENKQNLWSGNLFMEKFFPLIVKYCGWIRLSLCIPFSFEHPCMRLTFSVLEETLTIGWEDYRMRCLDKDYSWFRHLVVNHAGLVFDFHLSIDGIYRDVEFILTVRMVIQYQA